MIFLYLSQLVSQSRYFFLRFSTTTPRRKRSGGGGRENKWPDGEARFLCEGKECYLMRLRV